MLGDVNFTPREDKTIDFSDAAIAASRVGS
jgi:hypothetical protein